MHGIVIQNNYIHNTGPGAYLAGSKPYDDGSYRNQLNAEDYTSGVSGGDGFQILSAALGAESGRAAAVAASPKALSPNGGRGRKSRIARRGKPR
jgi:hypothetical protein